MLMHIYDKQCEIMESMEESKLSDSVFLQWDVTNSFQKNLENKAN